MVRVSVKRPPQFRSREMSAYVRDQAKKVFGEKMKKDAEEVTSGWQGERPEWKIEYMYRVHRMDLELTLAKPDSKGALKWLWLDKGTKPHPIYPVKAKVLAFPSIYRAGSVPNILATIPSSSGGPTVFSKGVMHPGIEPRNWSLLLQKDWQEYFEKHMKPVMERAAKISGHGGE